MTADYILLKSQSDAMHFVNTVSRYSCRIDLQGEKSLIDGKSILGVLGLGIGHIMKIIIYDDNALYILQEISPYIAEPAYCAGCL